MCKDAALLEKQSVERFRDRNNLRDLTESERDISMMAALGRVVKEYDYLGKRRTARLPTGDSHCSDLI